MAFTKLIDDLKGILILMLFGLPLIASENIDCGGKSFHCLNSTHFMICVDLGGGYSSTVDDFVIPCPPPTVCQGSNRFECEFPPSTPAPIVVTTASDVKNDTITSVSTPDWEEINVTSTLYKTVSKDERLESTSPVSLTALFNGTIKTEEINKTQINNYENTKENNLNTSTGYLIIESTTVDKSENGTENNLIATTESLIIDSTTVNVLTYINVTEIVFKNLTDMTLLPKELNEAPLAIDDSINTTTLINDTVTTETIQTEQMLNTRKINETFARGTDHNILVTTESATTEFTIIIDNINTNNATFIEPRDATDLTETTTTEYLNTVPININNVTEITFLNTTEVHDYGRSNVDLSNNILDNTTVRLTTLFEDTVTTESLKSTGIVTKFEKENNVKVTTETIPINSILDITNVTEKYTNVPAVKENGTLNISLVNDKLKNNTEEEILKISHIVSLTTLNGTTTIPTNHVKIDETLSSNFIVSTQSTTKDFITSVDLINTNDVTEMVTPYFSNSTTPNVIDGNVIFSTESITTMDPVHLNNETLLETVDVKNVKVDETESLTVQLIDKIVNTETIPKISETNDTTQFITTVSTTSINNVTTVISANKTDVIGNKTFNINIVDKKSNDTYNGNISMTSNTVVVSQIKDISTADVFVTNTDTLNNSDFNTSAKTTTPATEKNVNQITTKVHVTTPYTAIHNTIDFLITSKYMNASLKKNKTESNPKNDVNSNDTTIDMFTTIIPEPSNIKPGESNTILGNVFDTRLNATVPSNTITVVNETKALATPHIAIDNLKDHFVTPNDMNATLETNKAKSNQTNVLDSIGTTIDMLTTIKPDLANSSIVISENITYTHLNSTESYITITVANKNEAATTPYNAINNTDDFENSNNTNATLENKAESNLTSYVNSIGTEIDTFTTIIPKTSNVTKPRESIVTSENVTDTHPNATELYRTVTVINKNVDVTTPYIVTDNIEDYLITSNDMITTLEKNKVQTNQTSVVNSIGTTIDMFTTIRPETTNKTKPGESIKTSENVIYTRLNSTEPHNKIIVANENFDVTTKYFAINNTVYDFVTSNDMNATLENNKTEFNPTSDVNSIDSTIDIFTTIKPDISNATKPAISIATSENVIDTNRNATKRNNTITVVYENLDVTSPYVAINNTADEFVTSNDINISLKENKAESNPTTKTIIIFTTKTPETSNATELGESTATSDNVTDTRLNATELYATVPSNTITVVNENKAVATPHIAIDNIKDDLVTSNDTNATLKTNKAKSNQTNFVDSIGTTIDILTTIKPDLANSSKLGESIVISENITYTHLNSTESYITITVANENKAVTTPYIAINNTADDFENSNNTNATLEKNKAESNLTRYVNSVGTKIDTFTTITPETSNATKPGESIAFSENVTDRRINATEPYHTITVANNNVDVTTPYIAIDNTEDNFVTSNYINAPLEKNKAESNPISYVNSVGTTIHIFTTITPETSNTTKPGESTATSENVTDTRLNATELYHTITVAKENVDITTPYIVKDNIENDFITSNYMNATPEKNKAESNRTSDMNSIGTTIDMFTTIRPDTSQGESIATSETVTDTSRNTTKPYNTITVTNNNEGSHNTSIYLESNLMYTLPIIHKNITDTLTVDTQGYDKLTTIATTSVDIQNETMDPTILEMTVTTKKTSVSIGDVASHDFTHTGAFWTGVASTTSDKIVTKIENHSIDAIGDKIYSTATTVNVKNRSQILDITTIRSDIFTASSIQSTTDGGSSTSTTKVNISNSLQNHETGITTSPIEMKTVPKIITTAPRINVSETNALVQNVKENTTTKQTDEAVTVTDNIVAQLNTLPNIDVSTKHTPITDNLLTNNEAARIIDFNETASELTTITPILEALTGVPIYTTTTGTVNKNTVIFTNSYIHNEINTMSQMTTELPTMNVTLTESSSDGINLEETINITTEKTINPDHKNINISSSSISEINESIGKISGDIVNRTEKSTSNLLSTHEITLTTRTNEEIDNITMETFGFNRHTIADIPIHYTTSPVSTKLDLKEIKATTFREKLHSNNEDIQKNTEIPQSSLYTHKNTDWEQLPFNITDATTQRSTSSTNCLLNETKITEFEEISTIRANGQFNKTNITVQENKENASITVILYSEEPVIQKNVSTIMETSDINVETTTENISKPSYQTIVTKQTQIDSKITNKTNSIHIKSEDFQKNAAILSASANSFTHDGMSVSSDIKENVNVSMIALLYGSDRNVKYSTDTVLLSTSSLNSTLQIDEKLTADTETVGNDQSMYNSENIIGSITTSIPNLSAKSDEKHTSTIESIYEGTEAVSQSTQMYNLSNVMGFTTTSVSSTLPKADERHTSTIQSINEGTKAVGQLTQTYSIDNTKVSSSTSVSSSSAQTEEKLISTIRPIYEGTETIAQSTPMYSFENAMGSNSMSALKSSVQLNEKRTSTIGPSQVETVEVSQSTLINSFKNKIGSKSSNFENWTPSSLTKVASTATIIVSEEYPLGDRSHYTLNLENIPASFIQNDLLVNSSQRHGKVLKTGSNNISQEYNMRNITNQSQVVNELATHDKNISGDHSTLTKNITRDFGTTDSTLATLKQEDELSQAGKVDDLTTASTNSSDYNMTASKYFSEGSLSTTKIEMSTSTVITENPIRKVSTIITSHVGNILNTDENINSPSLNKHSGLPKTSEQVFTERLVNTDTTPVMHESTNGIPISSEHKQKYNLDSILKFSTTMSTLLKTKSESEYATTSIVDIKKGKSLDVWVDNGYKGDILKSPAIKSVPQNNGAIKSIENNGSDISYTKPISINTTDILPTIKPAYNAKPKVAYTPTLPGIDQRPQLTTLITEIHKETNNFESIIQSTRPLLEEKLESSTIAIESSTAGKNKSPIFEFITTSYIADSNQNETDKISPIATENMVIIKESYPENVNINIPSINSASSTVGSDLYYNNQQKTNKDATITSTDATLKVTEDNVILKNLNNTNKKTSIITSQLTEYRPTKDDLSHVEVITNLRPPQDKQAQTNKPSVVTTTIVTEKSTPKVSTTVSQIKKSHFECRLRRRGRYADNDDCRKFYTCVGLNQPIFGLCPVNTVFSDIKKQCTKNLSHCIRNNQFKCVSEGRFGDFIENNVYYICVHSKLNTFVRFKFRCQNDYYLNQTSVRCIQNPEAANQSGSNDSVSKSTPDKKSKEDKKSKKKDNARFECEEEGKFVDPKNCRKYYICSKSSKSEEFRKRRKKCDSDEVFHKNKKTCVDAESYECS